MEIVGVIPARFASTRLPGKALLSETGRPLILHVIEAARRAQSLQRIIVATDDARIAEAVTGFGGEVMMTRADHPTGTDRVAEVAARLERARIIVNLQGDEPEISGHALDLVVALLANDARPPMATLATPIRDESIYRDPACVKVVCNRARPGALLLAEPNPLPSRRPSRSRARPQPRSPICTSASTRTAANSCWSSDRFPLSSGGRRETRAASRARSRLPDRRRHGRRAERRHRHTRRLPAVRRAVEGWPALSGIVRPLPNVRST